MRLLLLMLTLFIGTTVFSQTVEVMDFNKLEKKLSTQSDTVYVVNFWATWCKPCVEELPDFLKVEEELKNEKFKLILVSLDFAKHLDVRVKPFIKKNNISSEVILLDDPDANTWISKVNKDWDGSIPVTLIFNKNTSVFIDKTMTHNELKSQINKLIKR